MADDGWPVRRLKLLAVINAMPSLSDAAKVIAGVWIEASYEGRVLEMTVRETTRRRGRKERANTSRAIGKLERELTKTRKWLVIERPHTQRVLSGDMRIHLPILAADHVRELDAAYEAARLDRRGSRYPPVSKSTRVGEVASENGAPHVVGDTPPVSNPHAGATESTHRPPVRADGGERDRALQLYKELLPILGITPSPTTDRSTDPSERAKDIRLVAEWLLLLDQFFEGDPHMDARRLILTVAREERQKRPTTVVRYVRYLDKAMRREVDKFAKLASAVRAA